MYGHVPFKEPTRMIPSLQHDVIFSLKQATDRANHIVNNCQGAATLEGLTGIVDADCFWEITV